MKKSAGEKWEEMYPESEVKRYLGVLSEIHNEGLKTIREGFIIVNRKLDAHSKMIASLAEDVTEIKKELKKKVDYEEFAVHTKRLDRLEARA